MARDVRDSAYPINYDLSIGKVYLKAARWSIESTKKLNILCCRFGQDPALNLPSWVPDWTSKRYQNQLSPIAGYIAIGYTSTDAEFSHGSRILTVTGCRLRTIDVLGETFTEHRPHVRLTNQMKQTVAEWLRLALRKTPGSVQEHSLDQENDRINAFWQTLICNRAEPPYQIDEKWCRNMFDVMRGTVAVPEDGKPDSTLSEEERLQRYVAPLVVSLDNRMPGRRFFDSENALDMMGLGLGPGRAQLGDHICLLTGCDIPIILRSEGDHFVLVGKAYVHGFMQGEADSDIQSQKLPQWKFSIH